MINTATRDCISRKLFQILISLELLNVGHQFKPCQNPLLSQPNSGLQRRRLIVSSANCEVLIQKTLGNPSICTFFISLPNVYCNDKQEWRLSHKCTHSCMRFVLNIFYILSQDLRALVIVFAFYRDKNI